MCHDCHLFFIEFKWKHCKPYSDVQSVLRSHQTPGCSCQRVPVIRIGAFHSEGISTLFSKFSANSKVAARNSCSDTPSGPDEANNSRLCCCHSLLIQVWLLTGFNFLFLNPKAVFAFSHEKAERTCPRFRRLEGGLPCPDARLGFAAGVSLHLHSQWCRAGGRLGL